jgi:DNA-binding NarL/FixJ family response regulator
MTNNHSTSRYGSSADDVQRIFLVEDSPVIRESLIDVLDSADDGRQVVGTADTENDAVAQIAHSDADVAIIDINLREGSGIGVLERICDLDQAPPVRIVYTNHYSRRIHDEMRAAGRHARAAQGHRRAARSARRRALNP